MKLLPYQGLMIPGLHFADCSVWVLSWTHNPTPHQNMVEVWVLWYNGKKECYISPSDAVDVFKRYHDFHSIIPSTISVTQTDTGIDISVTRANEQVCNLQLKYRRSLKYGLVNLLLRIGNKEKAGEHGRTETGMHYHNIPNKLVLLGVHKAELNGQALHTIGKPKAQFALGDGKPSPDPIVNFCTHMLQE